nr:DNRLRE domain-containing protein [Anaerolineae bacterium]
MNFRHTRAFILLVGVLLVNSRLNSAQNSTPAFDLPTTKPDTQTQSTTARRVNAPYDVPGEEAAIFWFGRVTPTENYADVRVGYRDEYLFVHVAVFDRLLWYDMSSSSEDLTSWDSVTLYLNTAGNVGSVPTASAFRFDTQLNWWEDRDDYQASYTGDGSGWLAATLPFTTTSYWAGNAPNDETDDLGWATIFYVPYTSLGLSGPPEPDTIWGMALSLQDRDDVAGTMIPDQLWPETLVAEQPNTWGQLSFGLPSYTPPPATPDETISIYHGVNGADVPDADVGGSSDCGELAAPEYFPSWGELNYAGKIFLNVQNLAIIGDWPCLSKYYVTFPLDSLPPGKVIIAAELILYHFGNAGETSTPGPEPSLIQVLTVSEDWDEATLTWNNAPHARQNIGGTWVEPLETTPEWPGIPRHWDVSMAVADAYAEGTPLRLALYEADWAFHAGKYFYSSDIGGMDGEGRPTLVVTLGSPLATVKKTASPHSGREHEPITYTLSFLGTGKTLTLDDMLPPGVSEPYWYGLEGTT